MLKEAIALGIFKESRAKAAIGSGLISGLGSGLLTFALNKELEGAAPHAAKLAAKVGTAVGAFRAATYNPKKEAAIKRWEKKEKG